MIKSYTSNAVDFSTRTTLQITKSLLVLSLLACPIKLDTISDHPGDTKLIFLKSELTAQKLTNSMNASSHLDRANSNSYVDKDALKNAKAAETAKSVNSLIKLIIFFGLLVTTIKRAFFD